MKCYDIPKHGWIHLKCPIKGAKHKRLHLAQPTCIKHRQSWTILFGSCCTLHNGSLCVPSSTRSTMGRRSEQQDARLWLWRDKRTLGSDSFLSPDYPAVAFLGTCSGHLESKLKNKPLPLIIMKTMEPGNVYILWNDENLLAEAGQESSGNDAAAKDTGEKEFGINS